MKIIQKLCVCVCVQTDLQHHADVGFNLSRVFGELLREAENTKC